MEKKCCLITLFLLSLGCSRKINDWKSSYIYSDKSSIQKTDHYFGSRLIEKDSLAIIPASREESKNTGFDSSYLSTSFAWSIAIWKNGYLHHQIGNFPEMRMPIKIIYRDKWQTLHDSIQIRDTVYIYVNSEKTIKPSGWNQLWNRLGKILFLLILGGFFYKKFKRKF